MRKWHPVGKWLIMLLVPYLVALVLTWLMFSGYKETEASRAAEEIAIPADDPSTPAIIIETPGSSSSVPRED